LGCPGLPSASSAKYRRIIEVRSFHHSLGGKEKKKKKEKKKGGEKGKASAKI